MHGTNSREPRLPDDAALALWHDYHKSGDPRLRDRLVLSFAPLVKYIAFKKLRDLPDHIEVEDLISCGLEALIRALDRYDPSRGSSLQQFLWGRIQGAMLDELRRLDWAPRSVRSWQRDLTKAKTRFASAHGREPGETELAAAVGIPSAKLRDVEREIEQTNVSSLNATFTSDDGEHELIDLLADNHRDTSAEQAIMAGEAKQRLLSAIHQLPERERQVVSLLYGERWTLREIGQTLGVSESRACQLHTRAKVLLFRALADDRALLAAAA